MSIILLGRWGWRLGLALAIMLGLGLIPPRAARSAATCASGYALWASGRTRDNTLTIEGSGSTFAGVVHSNADLRISGSNNSISGRVEYVRRFENGGDGNRFPAPARVPATDAPVAYSIADYRPGGAVAEAARQAGRYRVINGDLDIAEPATLSGLYYVKGNAKLSASDLRGAVTIVAEGFIDVSGSRQQLTPYSGGLLFFSNRREPGASLLKLAGGDSQLRGVSYAPGGTIELSGSGNTIGGLLVGDALKLSGSNLRISFVAEYCPVAAPAAPAYAPGEVLVKLYRAADLAAVARDSGLDPAPIDQFGSRPIYRLRILDGSDPALKAAAIRPTDNAGGDVRVEYAEPNYIAQTPEARRGRSSWVIGGDAGSYAEQWAPARIRLDQAHQVSRGAGVTVAVLDTGVDLSHPALAGRLVPGYDFVDDDADPREEGVYGVDIGFGHGTHVAGLIALAAPEAKIMPVRVIDKAGVGNIWVLTEGLLFAAERGPDGLPGTGDEAEVINLSLGTLRPTQLLADLLGVVACDDDADEDADLWAADDDDGCARAGGVVVVAAAGNGGDTTPQYPAAEAVEGALAVGASTSDDTTASFSTHGSWVRLAAPGEAVVSTVPGGGYGSWSGTSMAAPLAAGTAALVRAAFPELGAPAVAARLQSTAAQIGGPIARRLDAAAAVGALPAPGTTNDGQYRLYMPLLR